MADNTKQLIDGFRPLMQAVADQARTSEYAREHFNHVVNDVMSTVFQHPPGLTPATKGE